MRSSKVSSHKFNKCNETPALIKFTMYRYHVKSLYMVSENGAVHGRNIVNLMCKVHLTRLQWHVENLPDPLGVQYKGFPFELGVCTRLSTRYTTVDTVFIITGVRHKIFTQGGDTRVSDRM